MPFPRIGLVPHTNKQSLVCPHCGSTNLTRRGTRKKKFEIVQLWRCSACKSVFTPNPDAMRNRTYPLEFITAALTDYNRGYTLEQTCARLAKKTRRRVSPTTISNWLADYQHLTTYHRLRTKGHTLATPERIITTIKLYHRQVYEFAFHRTKLALLKSGALDDKRAKDPKQSSARFSPLADFLEQIPKSCPHELFTADNGARSSQLDDGFIRRTGLVVVEKQNAATETAALIIPGVGKSTDRHPKLQRFMLTNDSTTIAIEIPIWLDEADIGALEREHRITLVSRNVSGAPRHVTGHIDFLQVRNGAVHILDYKPGARTDKPLAQLTLYALALTRRVPGLKLFDIKCAWFDEHVYNEFFPRLALRRSTSAR